MTSYNYLGYGVTDSNGVAKLDHDAQGQEISHSYTGVGAGEIDVLASLDNPVDEGSIVSETFVVKDCTWRDGGTTTDKNNSVWSVVRLSDTLDNCRGSEYTQIEGDTTSNWCGVAFNLPNNDFIMELDHYVNIANSNQLQFRNSDWTIIASPYNFDLVTGEWVHWVIRVDSNKITFTDSTGQTVQLTNNGAYRFIMRTIQGEPIRFKNVELYPI